jgi:ankyrin repeat protein
VVELLIKEGGRDLLFLTNNDGTSCLYMAAYMGHIAVVELLIKEGGRDLLFLTNNKGVSCLYMAAQNGHLAVVEVSVCVGVGCSGMSRACGVLPREM